MNKYIAAFIKSEYGFDENNFNSDNLSIIEEIITSDVTGIFWGEHEPIVWDYSEFPNLKRIVCSFNHIDKINICNNRLLEKIDWQGVRGNLTEKLDFSGNPHLKSVVGGQDGVVELDFSNNTELEDVNIYLNSYLRWIDLNSCKKLKRIRLVGANIPFVDLTNCNELEYCDINYLNLYRNKYDYFGPGYPRPLVFVSIDFDENIIPRNTRENKSYAYYLIRTKPNSIEEKFLNELKEKKNNILNIPHDSYGVNVAKYHYKLIDRFSELKM